MHPSHPSSHPTFHVWQVEVEHGDYLNKFGDMSWAALRAKGHTYADKAQERLGPVVGKNFRKEMTKAKRGTYRGGPMDVGQVNSIKF
jgi:hypothetical protein